MKRYLRLTYLLLLLSTCIPSRIILADVSPAASLKSEQIQALDKPVADIRQQIHSWSVTADIQIALVISVIIFGAIIAALHDSKSKLGVKVVLVLGVGTSILTGIKAELFQTDYKTLHRSMADANVIVARLDGMIAVFREAPVTDATAVTFKIDFDKQLDAFERVEKHAEGVPDASGSSKLTAIQLPVVRAQDVNDGQPKWLPTPPRSAKALYVVGSGVDQSLAAAKAASYSDALRQLLQALGQGAPYNSTETQKTLIASASAVEDTYFTYNAGTLAYSYYTLLRISRAFQRFQPSPIKFALKDWRPIDLAFNSVAGLFVLDDEGKISRISVDEQGVHLQEMFRLSTTSQPAALAVNESSVFVSSNNQTGCMVYEFSLQTSRTSQRIVGFGQGGCDGIAATSDSLYVVLSSKQEIVYWALANPRTNKMFSLLGIVPRGVMTFDHIGKRLIYANPHGEAYTISIPDGKVGRMTSDLGYVHSISSDFAHTLFASGKKVLFRSRADNRGETTPSIMQDLSGGLISGVAVDASDAVWVTDYDRGMLEGPFPLN